MFTKHITVAPQTKTLLIRNGRFSAILEPGVHRVFAPPFLSLATEVHRVGEPWFASRWSRYLIEQRPDIIERHFTMVRTSDSEIALVVLNGNLHQVMLPSKTVLFWKDAGHLKVEVIQIIEGPSLPESMTSALEQQILHTH